MPRGPLPEDPAVRALIAQARAAQISRRGLIGGAGALSLAAFLAACSGRVGGSGPAASASAGEDLSASEKTLTWANWSFYLDEDDDGNHPTLEAFMEKSGLTVNYDVSIDDNNTYFAKVRDQLALGQDIGADAVCLTDWMASIWIALRLRAGVRQGEHAQRCGEPHPEPAEPGLRPGPRELPAVAVGLRRNRLEQGEAAERTAERRGPVGPGAAGAGGRAQRDARHDGPHHAQPGCRHLGLQLGRHGIPECRWTCSRSRSRTVRSATSRATPTPTTSRTRTRSRRSCWSGDITAINAEVGDKFGVRPARLGRHAVERQLHDPDRLAAEGQRREAHRPLLRPARGRRGRRLGELHHTRRRCAGGAWPRSTRS